MDYDFITTCNWTSTGTFTLKAYRGGFTNVITSHSFFYREGTSGGWTETTNGQFNISATGIWQIANDWNKSGVDVLTHSYDGITAIDSCTDVFFDEVSLGATVGTSFMIFAWQNCSNLTSMPVGFNLPSGLTTVGDQFLYLTWFGCSSLTSMPDGFTIPSGITTIGNNFMRDCWNGCTSLESMSSGFNLPSGITDADVQFLYHCWENCTSLTSMPDGFTISSDITSSGDQFLTACWDGCTSLTSMPNGFNLPSGMTSTGKDFLRSCWDGCISLTSMPKDFNIPSGITNLTAGNDAMKTCWYNCTNLNSDEYTENITFKYSSIDVFGGTCPITPNTVGGSSGNPIDVAVNRLLAPPTVTTQAVTDVAGTTATGNGNVTDEGDESVTERGVCWNTTGTPDTGDDTATKAGTTGAFTADMTGLIGGTKYYVRAYAISSVGTSYGDEVTFVTLMSTAQPYTVRAYATNEVGTSYGDDVVFNTLLEPETSYRVRAYAINEVGISYGDTVTVETLANDLDINVSDQLNITEDIIVQVNPADQNINMDGVEDNEIVKSVFLF